jgi:hypothetical protein
VNREGKVDPMGMIFEALQQFFQAEAWPAYPVEGQPVLELNYQGENGRWTCYAHAREAQQQFLFYSVCSANVPPALRPAAAEYLTRANWGLTVGNFEMDWADGEIRYKTGLEIEGDWPGTATAKRVVYTNLLMMDRYLPGLMAVIYGQADPAEALQQAEAEQEASPARTP